MSDFTETERLRREINELLVLRDRAVAIAHSNIEKRLDTLNEFRGALSDQSRTLVNRAEFDLRFVTLADRISALEKSQNKLLGAMLILSVLIPIALKLLLK